MPRTLHEKLLKNDEYRLRFADRVYKHFTNGGALTRTNSEARFDYRKAQIDRAIIANAARWGSTDLDRDTWLTASAAARAFFAGRGKHGYGLYPERRKPAILRTAANQSGGRILCRRHRGLSPQK